MCFHSGKLWCWWKAQVTRASQQTSTDDEYAIKNDAFSSNHLWPLQIRINFDTLYPSNRLVRFNITWIFVFKFLFRRTHYVIFSFTFEWIWQKFKNTGNPHAMNKIVVVKSDHNKRRLIVVQPPPGVQMTCYPSLFL